MRNLSRRDLLAGAAAAGGAGLLAPKAFAEAGRGGPEDGLSHVDPELRASARQILARAAASPPLNTANLAAVRAGPSPKRPPLASPTVVRRKVPGAPGQPEVVVYVINASAGARRPAILHTHGGGYVLGSAASSVRDLQGVAAQLDCVVVTVEYRLAPETTYAGSVEDNYAALHWLHSHASDLGVDPARIAVMGESAGGGHAALLALMARDRGEIKLVLQVLVYPMLDDRTGTRGDPVSPIGTIVWTPAQNRFGWGAFLGQAPGTASVPSRAVPARYTDLRGVAPAFIGVGALDLFVDEDVDYARRLIDQLTPTELLVVPGAFHGFDGIAPQSAVSRAFTAAKLAALRRAFASPT